jgi:hypothetical protein
MATWTNDELSRIGSADELNIEVRRRDGRLRKPVTIWVVRDGDDLYVRSVRGAEGAWYRAAEASHQAHVNAGGVERDVELVDAGDDVGTAVDEAYRTKYRDYPASYVDPMVEPHAQGTTLKLVPMLD